MNILEVSSDLYLIDLPQRVKGFRRFISSWVVKKGSKAVVIDVGPSSTINDLVRALRKIGVNKVDYVLLTHIHIDHAGGIGKFLIKFPAKVVVHEFGVKHLLNPEKLWSSTKQVLGKLADVYGEIQPVPSKYIHIGDIEFAGENIEVVPTPGHAPHHQSYIYKDYMFIGELAGTHLSINDEFYLRPATPPRFIYEVMISSIDKMLKYKDMMICFAHYGYEESSKKMLLIAKQQLELWVNVTRNILSRYKDDIGKAKELIKERLLKDDIYFSKYYLLEDDLRYREDYFISNSIEGIIRYVLERMESR